MTIEEVKQPFRPQPTGKSALQIEREQWTSLEYLMSNFQRQIHSVLERKGCKPPELKQELFNDALLDFTDDIRLGKTDPGSFGELYRYLQRIAERRWMKHSENPHKEAIKRGVYGRSEGIDALDENRAVNRETNMTTLQGDNENELQLGDEQADPPSEFEVFDANERLQREVQQIIDQMEGDCPERIRRASYFRAEPLPDEGDVANSEFSIRHKENAADFGDTNAAQARRRLDECKNKLKTYIKQLVKARPSLRELLLGR